MHPTVDKIAQLPPRPISTGAAKSAARLDRAQAGLGRPGAGRRHLPGRQPVRLDGLPRRQDGPDPRRPLHDLGRHAQSAQGHRRADRRARLFLQGAWAKPRPTYAKNFERVRSLLERYRDISGGKLQVSFLDPEPFSDAEDRAVAAGLKGIRLNQEGDQGYFGLVGTNATDNESSIGFFAPDRERFLEYDVTKLVYTLANPKKRVIGMISSIPLDGAMPAMMRMGAQPTPPQMVMEQIREFFEVKTLEANIKEIPADVDVLMLVQPEGLTPDATYAIDQFALAGGKVLVFIDPMAEMAAPRQPDEPCRACRPTPARWRSCCKAWGVAYDPKKIAADIALRAPRAVRRRAARQRHRLRGVAVARPQRARPARRAVGRHRAAQPRHGGQSWQGGRRHLRVHAHHLAPAPRPCRSAPSASAQMPDAVGLLRNYKPEGKPLVLAARVSAQRQQRVPRRPPEGRSQAGSEEGSRPRPASRRCSRKAPPRMLIPEWRAKVASPRAVKPRAARRPASRRRRPSRVLRPAISTSIVIADTDLLNDQFWVEVRDFLGQQVAIPNAHNAAFVLARAGEPVRVRRADLAARPRHQRPALRSGRPPAPRCRAALPRQGVRR